jgi:predicted acyl esterase
LIVTRFPCETREIEHTLIPLRDGTNLAAHIWLPTDSMGNPVPAISDTPPQANWHL